MQISLNAQVNPALPCDKIDHTNRLPLEILVSIFLYLSAEALEKTLCVSRRWKTVSLQAARQVYFVSLKILLQTALKKLKDPCFTPFRDCLDGEFICIETNLPGICRASGLFLMERLKATDVLLLPKLYPQLEGALPKEQRMRFDLLMSAVNTYHRFCKEERNQMRDFFLIAAATTLAREKCGSVHTKVVELLTEPGKTLYAYLREDLFKQKPLYRNDLIGG